MAMKWIVRAKQEGIVAVDANDSPIVLEPGQRGWMDQALSLQAALRGEVDMLSPDGIDAFEAAQSKQVKPDGVQTEAEEPPVPEAEAPEAVAPAEETTAAAPTPVPSVAPAPRRHGPQIKMPVSGA